MPDRKRFITIGGTVAAIAGIGFFMQNSQSAGSHAAVQAGMQLPTKQVDVSDAELTSSAMQAQGVTDLAPDIPAPSEPVSAPTETAALADAPMADTPTLKEPALSITPEPDMTSAIPASQPRQTALVSDEPVISVEPQTAPAVSQPQSTANAGCTAEMTAETMAAALVKVSLSAPCLPNERVTMEHAGMKFTEATDASGMLEIVVPALEEQASFTANFGNGESTTTTTTVSSLSFYDRAVVQSEGESSVSLHALEYGADYDDNGHVWSGASGGIESAATGKGGFIISLGDPKMDKSLVAEVYTFPTGIAQQDGDVELSVEIEVTEMNCGRPIEATSLQTGASADMTRQALELTMPDCDAVGDFLVLKNLVNDLKVARN
ncbi:hypothetical protein [Marimonas lutisalis]|uniref:hypothetical protein n=1 Tax=Marimonas lutisalis TaxID=2545756 RepID=UPI0010F9EF80|nr:hypothetical protein [Marimonas lutisalis]